MSQLSLQLLGPPQITRDGAACHIDRKKALALLVYLVTTRQPCSRDVLATMFWPQSDQRKARASLRSALASIKKSIGAEWLDITRETICFQADVDLWLDIREFLELLGEWRAHGHTQEPCPQYITSLGEASKLYRDDFMAGFSLLDSPGFDEWQFFLREELRDELSTVLEWLAQKHVPIEQLCL